MKKLYVKESASGDPMTSSQEVYNSIKSVAKADQETMWLLGYNSGHKETYRECIFMGGVSECAIDLKIIFKRLLTHDCSAFILIHNHPGEKAEPSQADLVVTKRVKEAAIILTIEFLDHIILGGDTYYSFQANGLIKGA